MKDQNEPPVSVAARLAQASKISVSWLVTGVGPIEAGAGEEQGPSVPGGERDGFVYIRRYDVRVSAGPGSIVGDENVRDLIAFREDFVRRELGADPDDLYSIDAVGDSMKPTIEHGDTLTFVRLKGGVLPMEGIFNLGIGDSLLVKRVQVILNGIVLISDNPAYKPETLSAAEAKEVRWLGRLKVISRVV